MGKIIINGRFLLHRVTGVERYAREILAELDQLAQPGEFELAVPPEAKEVPALRNIAVTRCGRLHNILWEHLSFPLHVKRQRGVLLNLCNTSPLPSPGMVCIFDMKIRQHPEFFSKKFVLWYRLLFANASRRAKWIFTDSNAAGREIEQYYPAARGRVVAAPCAWQHFERTAYDEGALQKYGLQKGDYYFAMGSLDPNKNFAWIAEAARKNPNRTFAVAGSINKTVFSDKLSFTPPANMQFLGYVSDGEARTLMRDCAAFLFPSICEGFGMPPLEALSAGAPALAVSDIPVMHEIFGDAATYIDPVSAPNDLQCRAVEPEERAEILGRYSWRRSAEIIRQTCLR